MKSLLLSIVLILSGLYLANAAFINIGGKGVWFPSQNTPSGNPPAYSTTLIDATDEKISVCGPVLWKNGSGSKSIRNVAFRLGTVVKAGGTDILVTLGDVSTTSGPPLQWDGISDETVVVADASYASNTWIETGNFSADRSVVYGSTVCVIYSFDGARLGSDSFIPQNINASINTLTGAFTVVGSSLSSSAWVSQSQSPGLALKFSDGTYGTIGEGYPFNAINSHTFSSSSTPDERALSFWNPYPIKIDAIWVGYSAPTVTGSAGTLRLYEGTTVLESVSVSTITTSSSGIAKYAQLFFPGRTLTANTTYYVAFAPGDSNTIAYSVGFNGAGIADLFQGGASHAYTQRTDAGAWDVIISTQQFIAGYRISAISDGVGSSAGTVGYGFAQ